MQKIQELNIQIKHFPIKRMFDILFALLLLALFSPFFIFFSIAIFFTSQGKIIFAHQRIGRGGTPFFCYKFRTMYADAETRLNELLSNNSEMRLEWLQKRKLKNDPRITPIGKLLRKSSLDELPQLWNVLKGDLSIVGPRPVVMEEILEYFGEKASKILSVRPGLTCLWQVSGRSDTSYAARVALDEKYVDNRSFLLDLILIFKTIPALLTSRGAY